MTVQSPHRKFHLMQVLYTLGQGGAESLARDLAAGFDPSRFRSSVCAIASDGPIGEDLRRASVPSFVIGRRPGFDWRLIPKLYDLFRRQHVNVVQTHQLTQLIYGGLGARLAGAFLVHVEHITSTIMSPKEKRRLRILAPLCHKIVAVGEGIRDFLLQEVQLAPSKVGVIRNGVDMALYNPESGKSRESLGLAPGEHLIGNVGRLETQKDQATLLLAFQQVVRRIPDSRLVIVGQGYLLDDLQRLAGDLGIAGRVDFLGIRKDVADLLPHFEIFALSSIDEGLPLAVLEAMACARPVVATAVGEIPQLITEGVTGLTVPPGDPKSLAEGIVSLLEKPIRAREMGRAARKTIEEGFSFSSTVAQYQALYESLLGLSIPVGGQHPGWDA